LSPDLAGQPQIEVDHTDMNYSGMMDNRQLLTSLNCDAVGGARGRGAEQGLIEPDGRLAKADD
tara:strand:+ start:337980 stop:338168 length:189 start_codon:yes stop_codon:yes gene_type:complete